MTMRLTPYGSANHAHDLAKVGKSKTPHSLVARMPSADLAAKVGPRDVFVARASRVVRRNGHG